MMTDLGIHKMKSGGPKSSESQSALLVNHDGVIIVESDHTRQIKLLVSRDAHTGNENLPEERIFHRFCRHMPPRPVGFRYGNGFLGFNEPVEGTANLSPSRISNLIQLPSRSYHATQRGPNVTSVVAVSVIPASWNSQSRYATTTRTLIDG